MKCYVATSNPLKLKAVEEISSLFPTLSISEVKGEVVESGVSEQPMSFEETLEGARQRAIRCWKPGSYSVGIESGFMEAKESHSGYLQFTACVVYDGDHLAVGTSSLFECPKSILRWVHEGHTLNDATFHSGLTSNPSIGKEYGLISLLSDGNLSRKELTKQGLLTSFMQFTKKKLYLQD